MNLRQLRNLVNETVRSERKKSQRRSRRSPRFSTLIESTVRRVLLEEDQVDELRLVNDAGSGPLTLVVLYGPPAAGKGAAKKNVAKFAGIEGQEQHFGKWLEGLKEAGKNDDAWMQEEDKWMVDNSKKLSGYVYVELLKRCVDKPDEIAKILEDYYHVNESETRYELGKVVPSGYIREKLLPAIESSSVEEIAEKIQKSKKSIAFWTQARGFSKTIEGAPEELNACLGLDENGKTTTGLRTASAGRYMKDVVSDINNLFANVDKTAEGPYGSVYLIDQAGESTANLERIEKLKELKGTMPDGIKIIGCYIYQPADRTKLANLHRAAIDTGRRVAQSEVDRIYQNAPEISADGSTVISNGAVVDAMVKGENAFDVVKIFAPSGAATDETMVTNSQEQQVQIGNAICEPFGKNTGTMGIEGCKEYGEGDDTDFLAYSDLEEEVMDDANLDGTEFPKEPSDADLTALEKALKELDFDVDQEKIRNYILKIAPKGSERGGKYGKNTWGEEMFTGDGSKAKNELDPKGATNESIDLRRWNKLAGLLKD